ncbi:MAG: molybdenum cofactor guanylyltransferase [Deltaproteobacteria bacterium]|nr:molybdenum cofactor guanylyltransferase [Deltaproteobacteria bacterium]
MTGIILAGGKSSRMGFNKALIEVNGLKIIERTVNLFKEIFDEIIIITNTPLEYERFDVKIATDLIKDAGALGGIYTGIFHAHSNHSFVAACDMPFLDKDIILKMLNIAVDSDAIVPFANDKFHPLHAVYSKNCLKPMEEAIKNNDLRINNLFQKIRIKKVEDIFIKESALRSLCNVNTTEDLNEITKHPATA